MDQIPGPYWSQRADELFTALGSKPDGLSQPDAAARLRTHGPNAVEDAKRLPALRLLLRQFESPLVLILVFGAGVSLFLREWIDASIILVIVMGSTLLGFFQEYRASKAITELRKRIALTARVVRDGVAQAIPLRDLVPGDVVQLSAGNLVPADGVVLEARDFLVTESALTGELFPVEKQCGVAAIDAPISRRGNCVFFGTSVRSGTASVLIVHTGRDTAFGDVVARLRGAGPETEFARGLRGFGYLLLRVMVVIVLFVLVVNQLMGRPVIDSLLFAVALAVGLSPELLPAIVSVTLSSGARAMARRGVIVRRLEAIENLGGMDVLCTDKTGTLTRGVITLTDAVDCDGKPNADLRRAAYLNAFFETGIENPLDQAIIADGESRRLSAAGYAKLDEIPYDFRRKRLTIVVREEVSATTLIVMKGAYDNVLSCCESVLQTGIAVPLGADIRARLDTFYRTKSAEGFRVLGVATRATEPKAHYSHDDESAMRFEGFLLFFDPPKPQARKTVDDLAALGIEVKIVTGDNRYVAAHVAEAIGIDANALLTGEQLAGLRAEALWHLAERTRIFAEVDPQQKEGIVRALQHRGHAVGYLGDGINDAAALHVADAGISVDQAVDVARDSADIILLEPDLDVLREGVEGGRRTFANTLKYIGITTSANFGNMISMALVTPFLPFLPLLAKQILLNNFLSDVPSIAISSDNVDATAVKGPQRWNIHDVQRFMIVFGLVSSLFDGLTFLVLLVGFHAGEREFQTAWFVVSLLTELAVVLALRTRASMFKSRPSRLLLWTTGAVAGVAVAVPYLSPVASIFGFVALPATLMAALCAIVAAYVAATEVVKRYFLASARARASDRRQYRKTESQ